MSPKLAIAIASLMIVALSHCVSNAATYQPNQVVLCVLNADGSVSNLSKPSMLPMIPGVDDIKPIDIYDYVHPQLHNNHSMFQLPNLQSMPGSGLTRNA